VCVNDVICDMAAHLGHQLEEHVSQHLSGVVRLIRTEHREGLIRARIYGADHATGDVSNYACLLCKEKRCRTPQRSLDLPSHHGSSWYLLSVLLRVGG